MASFVADEAVWKPEDWKWDAHNLKAMPADDQSPAQTPAGKNAKGQAGEGAKQGCQVRACCRGEHACLLFWSTACFCIHGPQPESAIPMWEGSTPMWQALPRLHAVPAARLIMRDTGPAPVHQPATSSCWSIGRGLMQANEHNEGWSSCCSAAPATQPPPPVSSPPICANCPLPHSPRPFSPSTPFDVPQVEGCTIEVGGMKDYHSRYKICEFHLKANVVQKDGKPHRFCQQARPAAHAGHPATPASCCRCARRRSACSAATPARAFHICVEATLPLAPTPSTVRQVPAAGGL
jgi:hypothetical protein